MTCVLVDVSGHMPQYIHGIVYILWIALHVRMYDRIEHESMQTPFHASFTTRQCQGNVRSYIWYMIHETAILINRSNMDITAVIWHVLCTTHLLHSSISRLVHCHECYKWQDGTVWWCMEWICFVYTNHHLWLHSQDHCQQGIVDGI